MGMWATGKLAFGVDLGENAKKMFYTDTINEDGDDYTDGDISNIYFWWCALQEGVQFPGHFNREMPDYKKWNKAGKQFQEKYPFSIATYGSYGEGEKHFLYLYGTEQTVWQENSVAVKITEIDPTIFKEFSDKFNLNLSKPEWSMMVKYG